jgi:hypothetical protein
VVVLTSPEETTAAKVMTESDEYMGYWDDTDSDDFIWYDEEEGEIMMAQWVESGWE